MKKLPERSLGQFLPKIVLVLLNATNIENHPQFEMFILYKHEQVKNSLSFGGWLYSSTEDSELESLQIVRDFETTPKVALKKQKHAKHKVCLDRLKVESSVIS